MAQRGSGRKEEVPGTHRVMMATEDSCLTRMVASTLGWGSPKAILKSRISAQVVNLEAIPGGPGKGWVSETGQGRRPRQCALIADVLPIWLELINGCWGRRG